MWFKLKWCKITKTECTSVWACLLQTGPSWLVHPLPRNSAVAGYSLTHLFLMWSHQHKLFKAEENPQSSFASVKRDVNSGSPSCCKSHLWFYLVELIPLTPLGHLSPNGDSVYVPMDRSVTFAPLSNSFTLQAMFSSAPRKLTCVSVLLRKANESSFWQKSHKWDSFSAHARK